MKSITSRHHDGLSLLGTVQHECAPAAEFAGLSWACDLGDMLCGVVVEPNGLGALRDGVLGGLGRHGASYPLARPTGRLV